LEVQTTGMGHLTAKGFYAFRGERVRLLGTDGRYAEEERGKGRR